MTLRCRLCDWWFDCGSDVQRCDLQGRPTIDVRSETAAARCWLRSCDVARGWPPCARRPVSPGSPLREPLAPPRQRRCCNERHSGGTTFAPHLRHISIVGLLVDYALTMRFAGPSGGGHVPHRRDEHGRHLPRHGRARAAGRDDFGILQKIHLRICATACATRSS